MSKQRGYVFEHGNGFHIRYYVHENGVRKQRSKKLCDIDDLHPSKSAPEVLKLVEEFMLKINMANAANDASPAGHSCPICQNRCRRTIEQKFAPKR